MKNGVSKSRKGDREIISVSLPLVVYDAMQEVCDLLNLNRSSMIASAIVEHLSKLGVKVGER